MQRKDSCQACTFMLHGVKTRKAIAHTCGRTFEELIELKKNNSIIHKINRAHKAVNENFDKMSDDQIKSVGSKLDDIIKKTEDFINEHKRNIKTGD